MSRFPAFLAATAFAAGVWLGGAAWRPPLWWTVAVLACAGGALLFCFSHPSKTAQGAAPAFALALLALVSLGALDIGARHQGSRTPAEDARMWGTEEVQVTG